MNSEKVITSEQLKNSISILKNYIDNKIEDFVSIGDIVDSAKKLSTARTLKIGNKGKSFDGTADVSWSLEEIGAAPESHTHTNYATKDYVDLSDTQLASAINSCLPLSGGTLNGNLTAWDIVANNVNSDNAGIGSLEISSTDGSITFWDGYGVIRTYPQELGSALYLQCSSDSEVKITAAGDATTYVPLRAWNLIANNGVYAKGTNLSSDRNLKENIEYLQMDNKVRLLEDNIENITLHDMYDFIKDELYLASYNYIDDEHNKQKINFVAQDLLYNNNNEDSKVGQLIVNAEEAVRENDNLNYDLGNYVSILAGALKCAINEIETLRSELKELKFSK